MIKTDQNRKWAYYTFIFGITWLTYANFLNMSVTSIIGSNNIDTIISVAIIGWCVLNYIRQKQFKIKADIIILFFVMMVLLYLDKLHPFSISSSNDILITEFLMQGFLGYVFARVLFNEKEIDHCLIYVASIIYISCFFMPFFPSEVAVLFGGTSAESYGAYLLFGYRMLPGVLMFIHLYYRDGKKIYLILFLGGFFEILLFGNRGAVIAIVVFYVLYTILYGNAREKTRRLILITVFLFVYLYFTSEDGVLLLARTLSRFNITPRNIYKFLDNTISETGRDGLYADVTNYISENWLTGVGFSGAWKYGKPHNMIFEMALNFGVIGAGVLIFIFVSKTLKILFDKSTGPIMLIFICAGIIPSMFSGSYVVSWMFWVMLGILVTLSISKKNKQGDPLNAGTDSSFRLQQG